MRQRDRTTVRQNGRGREDARQAGLGNGTFGAGGNGQYLAGAAMQRYGNTRIRQVTLCNG